MSTNSANFLTELYNLLNRYFSLEEIRTICFNLSVDYDNIPGEGKSAKTRELILGLARVDRLPQLVNMVREMRPNAPWPSVPADFQLPDSGPWSASSASQTTQNIYQGDVVHGDKVSGDKVGGDKISVGNISGSTGVAIGRGASANVNIQQGMPPEQLNALFAPLLAQVQQAPPEQQPVVEEKVQQLKEEAAKGEKAEDETVANLIQDIADILPDAVEAITGIFTNTIVSKSAGAATKFILGRLRRNR
jgi:hypothetical protein